MKWDGIYLISPTIHLLIPLNPLSFSNLGSANKTSWDACLKKHVAVSHTYFFFFNFLIFSIFRVVRPPLPISDFVHHPSKKTWIYSLILPFLWPLATIYLLPVSMDSPISGQVWVLGSCFLKPWGAVEYSINPEASACRQVRQSPREETASQVTLEFITLRGEGVLLTIMQGHKACRGCMVTLSEWRGLNLESKWLPPRPAPNFPTCKEVPRLTWGTAL